eukprot:tig00001333_g8188.t1
MAEPESKRPKRATSPREDEFLIVSVVAKNRPELPAVVTRVVADSGCRIVDIKQIVVHETYTVSIVVHPEGQHAGSASQVIKELLFKAKELGAELDFKLLPAKDIHAELTEGKQYAITVINEAIPPVFLAELTETLASHNVNIDKIQMLSEAGDAAEASSAPRRRLQCIEFSVTFAPELDLPAVKRTLLALSKKHAVDVALQPETLFRRSKRLIVMDMDSTLIQQEVIEELAKHAGVFEKVQEITHRAMNGELDFNQSLEERCKLLKGIPADVFQDVIKNLLYTEGVPFFARALKSLGYKLAVISGGFTPVTEHVKKELSFDYAFANTLEVDEKTRTLTGRTVGPIVNAQRKADLLRFIAQKEGISLDQSIAIGDGANDLLMLSVAGLGIAFNAKPKVQEAANFRINQRNMDSVLYLLGITDRDARALLPARPAL